jgi:hypothetical protein
MHKVLAFVEGNAVQLSDEGLAEQEELLDQLGQHLTDFRRGELARRYGQCARN